MLAHTKTPHSPSTHLIPFLYFLITSLFTLSTTHVQAAPPIPVTYPGSARTPTRFFILSGATEMDIYNYPLVTTSQFYYLDLSTSWNTTTVASPAWVQLRQGPKSGNFPGTASADSNNLFFFRIPGGVPVYQFSLETGNWSPAMQAVPRFDAAGEEGIGAVTDPGTDLVYLAGGYTDPNHGLLDVWNWKTGNVTSTALPDPNLTGVFADRTYYTAAWCKARGSVLYWGGYSRFTRTNTVSELKPPNDWSTLPTNGNGPSNRADHCMAINDDGTKLIVFGGQLAPGVLSNELFILTIDTGTWIKGAPSALPRIYSACTIAGDQLIVWGGLTNMTHIASSEVLLYNMAINTWVTQYTPTAAYQDVVVPPIPGAVVAGPLTNATVSGVSPTAPSSPTGGGGNGAEGRNLGSDGSNAGGIGVGGIIGSVAGVALFSLLSVGVWIYRRRRQQKSAVPLEAMTRAGGRDDGNAGYQEPQTLIAATAHKRHPQGAVNGSAVGHQDPQYPADGDMDFQLRQKDIEDQQRQVELNRELPEQVQQHQPPGPQYRQEHQQCEQQILEDNQQQLPVQYSGSIDMPQYPVTVQALHVTTS